MIWKRLLILSLLVVTLVACDALGDEATLPTFTPDVTSTPSPLPPTPVPSPRPTLPPVATVPPENFPDTTADPAFVRVVHLAPQLAQSVSVYVGETQVAARYRYGTTSQESVQLFAGDYALRLVPSGANPTAANALYESRLTLDPASDVILAVVTEDEALTVQVFAEDLSPTDSDQARVTFINGVADSPPLGVSSDGETLADDLGYGSISDPLQLPSGEYRFSFRQGGGGALHIVDVPLMANRTYTIILVDAVASPSLESFILSQPTRLQSYVQAVHAVFDGPPVRVLVGNALLVEDLAYGGVTDRFIPLPVGSQPLRIESMTPSDGPLYEGNINLQPNQQAQIIVYGVAGRVSVGLFPLDDTPIDPNVARLQVVNVLPNQDTVELTINTRLIEDDPLRIDEAPPPDPAQQDDPSGQAEDDDEALPQTSAAGDDLRLAYGDAFQTLVSSGLQAYEVAVVLPDGALTNLFDSGDLTIEAGQLYTYLLMGRQGEDSRLLATDAPLIQADAIAPEADLLAQVRVANGYPQTLSVELAGQPLRNEFAVGAVTDWQSLVGSQELALRVQSAEGDTLLDTGFFTREGVNTTVLIVGEGDRLDAVLIEVSRAAEGQIDPDRPARLEAGIPSTFVNALYEEGTITLNYLPAQLDGDDIVVNPQDAIQPNRSDDIRDIGEQFPVLEFDTVGMLPGAYVVTVVEAETGESIDEVFLEVAEDVDRYIFVLTAARGDIEFLPILLPQ